MNGGTTKARGGAPIVSKCTSKLPRPSFFCCSGYGVPKAELDQKDYDFALEFAIAPQQS
jgi:hypothetical protein